MMEYENRYRPKWYQVMMLIIYSVVVVYVVLVNNPYLYSSKQFQEALAGKKDNAYLPVVTEQGAQLSLNKQIQPPPRFSWLQNSSEASGETRDRRYSEVTLTPLLMELDKKPENSQWNLMDDQIIAISKSNEVYAMDFEGKTLWQFSSANTEEHPFYEHPLADKNSLFLVNRSGQIYTVDLQTGQLLWASRFEGELLSNAFSYGDELYVVQKVTEQVDAKKKPTSRTQLVKVNRANGAILEVSNDLGIKAQAHFSYTPSPQNLYLTSAERILVLELPSMKTVWQKTLSSEVIGPAVLAEGRVLVSQKEGKFKIFSQSKGTELYEVDLEHPLASAASYIPIYNRAAVTTTDGYQHVIDLDAGKRLWRFDLNNKNNVWQSWTTRLSGNFIEELSMKWKYKGWTIWSPCVEKRICIYNPEHGQIVGRVMLSGQLSTLPRFKERSFYVVLEQDNGYALGHYVERPVAKTVSQSE